MKIVAVVPAYNVEKKIEEVVLALQKYVEEVIVVDDGSNDNTFEVASKCGATVLLHEVNRGQGAALQTGNEYAKILDADYVVHFDADGQHEPQYISDAIKLIDSKKNDIVFGSRYLQIKNNIPWLKRKIIHPIGKLINRIFFGLKMTDAHNGFRVFSRNALEKIQINHDRMAHATEIPAQAAKKGLKYEELPIKVIYQEYGQNTIGGLKIIKDLIVGSFLK